MPRRHLSVFFGFTPRLLIASFAAYLTGEIANASTMSHLKKLTGGVSVDSLQSDQLWLDRVLTLWFLLTIAFAGTFPLTALFSLILNQWLFKVTYEVLATPLLKCRCSVPEAESKKQEQTSWLYLREKDRKLSCVFFAPYGAEKRAVFVRFWAIYAIQHALVLRVFVGFTAVPATPILPTTNPT